MNQRTIQYSCDIVKFLSCFQDEETYNDGEDYVAETETPPLEKPEETPGQDYEATAEEGAHDNDVEDDQEYSEGEPAVDEEEEYSYVYETERKEEENEAATADYTDEEEEGDAATADYNTDEAYNER